MSAAVTVVVATRDRRLLLLRTLTALGALPERPPVIVVDDGSGDGTPEAVRFHCPWARLVPLAAPAGPSARNAGVKTAGTPLVAFADDDSWYEDGALAMAAGVFAAQPRLGLVAAQVLVGPGNRPDPTCEAMASTPLRGFLACGAVVRRDAFLAAGGFHPWMFTGGEEEYLAARLSAAGWDLEYRPDVVAHHWPPRTSNHRPRRRVLARNAALTDLLLRPGKGALAATLNRVVRQPFPNDIAGTVEGLAAGIWLGRRTTGSS